MALTRMRLPVPVSALLRFKTHGDTINMINVLRDVES